MEAPNPFLRHIGGRAVAPGAAFTSLTMNTGDSLTMPNSNGKILVSGIHAKFQAAGIVRVHGQTLANDNDGFRFNVVTGQPYEAFPDGFDQVNPQDVINCEVQGSAVAGDFELVGFELYETNSKQRTQKLINYQEAVNRKVHDLTVSFTITGGAGGGYTGETAWSAATSFFVEGNTDYAVVGFLINTPCNSVVFYGPGTGNTRIGAPADSTNKEMTRRYWFEKSRNLGVPYIPVINSADMANTFCGVMCDENAGTFLVNLCLWRLR